LEELVPQQYEKFSRFLRNELCSNNLRDFGLKKGLDHLDSVRQRFQVITDRFAAFQAQCLNVHGDFPLLQPLALPLTIGAVRYPGIKIHEVRIIRLLEVLLDGGNSVGGWTARQIHQVVLTTFRFPATNYGLNQLRYDLRKLKGHGLLQRDGSRYAYQLTPKGFGSLCYFCSSTNGSVVPWPTAASTTGPTLRTDPTPSWKRHITRPTPPFRISSTSLLPLEVTPKHIEVFLFTIFDLRI